MERQSSHQGAGTRRPHPLVINLSIPSSGRDERFEAEPALAQQLPICPGWKSVVALCSYGHMPNREEASALSIDAALVRRLIAAQFPEWANLPIRPVKPGGWDNRTFRLGEHMSVRLPSGPAYVAQVEKEHRWLPELAPICRCRSPFRLPRARPTWPIPGRGPSTVGLTADRPSRNGSPISINSPFHLPISLLRFIALMQLMARRRGSTISIVAAVSRSMTARPVPHLPDFKVISTRPLPRRCGPRRSRHDGSDLRSGCMATSPGATCSLRMEISARSSISAAQRSAIPPAIW